MNGPALFLDLAIVLGIAVPGHDVPNEPDLQLLQGEELAAALSAREARP